jgi:hypothetical protein
MSFQNCKTFLYAISAVALLSTVSLFCGPAGKKPAAVVTYASPDSMIVRGATNLTASIGTVLKEKDVIQTGQGPLDLQTTSGAIIRVRPYTRLELAVLLSNQTVHIDLKSGSMSARVRRASADENFLVSTPTAIAGVRGTQFTVSEDPETGAQVTVIDGKVAMSPRTGDSPATTVSTEQEIVLEAAEQGQVTDDRDTVEKQTVELTLRDQADFDSMVEVDTAILAKAGDLEQPSEAVAGEIQADYNRKRDLAFDRISERAESAASQGESDLLETLRFKDGASYSGTIITQAGDTLIIQGKDGIKRFKVDEVRQIEYGDL